MTRLIHKASFAALAFACLGAIAACGNDASCISFCEGLGCPADSAACDSGSQCACFGCDAFYEQYYQEAEEDRPACEAGPELE